MWRCGGFLDVLNPGAEQQGLGLASGSGEDPKP